MGYKIAIAGATGNVGREMLAILADSDIDISECVALASPSSIGREVSFGEDDILRAEALESYDFDGTDIALFSAGGTISGIHAPRAAESGCVVIDNSSKFRMDHDIPLIVPEVNPEAIEGFRERNIIANPNCSTIQMVVALKPLHDIAPIKRVVVATYQSVSGGGRAAMDELFDHTKAIYMNDRKEPELFSRQIPFNVIPQIDIAMDDGSYKEEWKMVHETKKILSPEIEVVATCVRVPVFVAHSEAVNIEFHEPISAEQAREALQDAPGIVVIDDHEANEFMTPIDAAGEDAVFVSRIREDPTVPYGLNIWVVSDNLRKGAALNTVQIAELLVNEGHL